LLFYENISVVGKDIHNLKYFKLQRYFEMQWAVYVACMGEKRGAYRSLVGKPEGKRPIGKPRCRREGNIKMDLQQVGSGGMDWIDLAQD
jgi:hypothetical protein